MLDVNTADNKTWNDSKSWLLTDSKKRNVDWLGAGDTAEKIIQILKNYLK
jgi:hypothetical protein